MQVEVSNILGLEDFTSYFHPGKPVLVHGENSAGKTSLAVAIAALTAQQANPLHLPKGDQKLYISLNEADGVASLDDGRVLWLGTSISTTGDSKPDAVPHAVGLVDFLAVKRGTADRAALWEDLFLPKDPRAILEPHFKDKFSEQELKSCIDTINEQGWKKALSLYEEHRRAAKRNWSDITGDGWSEKRAKTWTPANWREELTKASEASLQAALTDAHDAKSKLVAAQAVAEDQILRARHVRDNELPAAETRLRDASEEFARVREHFDTANRAIEEAEAEEERVRDKWRGLGRILKAVAPHKCPHCEGGLVIDKGKVGAWEPPTKEQVDQAEADKEPTRRAGKEASGRVASAKALKASAFEDYEVASRAMTRAEADVEILRKEAALAGETVREQASQEELDAAQNRISQCSADVVAWKQKTDAEREAGNVSIFDEVCQILGPTGARATLMQKAMNFVRGTIKSLCDTAGWTPVEITRDFSIRSGGVAIRMAAKNERARAQWLCQMASAIAKKSGWLVLDEADVLWGDTWEGLMAICKRLSVQVPDLRVVVCATGPDDMVPEEGWDTIDLSE